MTTKTGVFGQSVRAAGGSFTRVTCRESVIERALVAAVKAHGGEVRKLRWIGRRAAPDRLVLLNGVHFVELKRPGKKPTVAQDRELQTLRSHGARAHWVDTIEKAEALIESIARGR
jgi:hypothetical protein